MWKNIVIFALGAIVLYLLSANFVLSLVYQIESCYEAIGSSMSKQDVDYKLQRLKNQQSSLSDIPDGYNIGRYIDQEEGIYVIEYCVSMSIYCFHVVFDDYDNVLVVVPTHN